MAHSILKIDKYGRPYPGWSETPPLPLMPYTFVDWLTPKLRQDMTVFEFGSGNSTLYFAQHCRSVISAEHHVLWGTALGKILPPNVTMVYFPLNRLNQYVAFIDSFPEPFDIVVVDGMVREECIRKACLLYTSPSPRDS